MAGYSMIPSIHSMLWVSAIVWKMHAGKHATSKAKCCEGPHQITLVQQQQHVLVPGIPLEMVFQVLAPGAKRIPGIQYLHNKGVLPMQVLPKTCFVHQSSQLLCLPAFNGQ